MQFTVKNTFVELTFPTSGDCSLRPRISRSVPARTSEVYQLTNADTETEGSDLGAEISLPKASAQSSPASKLEVESPTSTAKLRQEEGKGAATGAATTAGAAGTTTSAAGKAAEALLLKNSASPPPWQLSRSISDQPYGIRSLQLEGLAGGQRCHQKKKKVQNSKATGPQAQPQPPPQADDALGLEVPDSTISKTPKSPAMTLESPIEKPPEGHPTACADPIGDTNFDDNSNSNSNSNNNGIFNNNNDNNTNNNASMSGCGESETTAGDTDGPSLIQDDQDNEGNNNNSNNSNNNNNSSTAEANSFTRCCNENDENSAKFSPQESPKKAETVPGAETPAAAVATAAAAATTRATAAAAAVAGNTASEAEQREQTTTTTSTTTEAKEATATEAKKAAQCTPKMEQTESPNSSGNAQGQTSTDINMSRTASAREATLTDAAVLGTRPPLEERVDTLKHHLLRKSVSNGDTVPEGGLLATKSPGLSPGAPQQRSDASARPILAATTAPTTPPVAPTALAGAAVAAAAATAPAVGSPQRGPLVPPLQLPPVAAAAGATQTTQGGEGAVAGSPTMSPTQTAQTTPIPPAGERIPPPNIQQGAYLMHRSMMGHVPVPDYSFGQGWMQPYSNSNSGWDGYQMYQYGSCWETSPPYGREIIEREPAVSPTTPPPHCQSWLWQQSPYTAQVSTTASISGSPECNNHDTPNCNSITDSPQTQQPSGGPKTSPKTWPPPSLLRLPGVPAAEPQKISIASLAGKEPATTLLTMSSKSVKAPPPPPSLPPSIPAGTFAGGKAPCTATTGPGNAQPQGNRYTVTQSATIVGVSSTDATRHKAAGAPTSATSLVRSAGPAATAYNMEVQDPDTRGDGHYKTGRTPEYARSQAPARRWCCLHLFMDEDNFDLVPMLIGRGGSNTQEISKAGEAKVRVRGKGSGHKEVSTGQEAPTPLMLVIAAESDKLPGFYIAVKMAIMLLRRIERRYRSFCRSKNITPAEPAFAFGPMSNSLYAEISSAIGPDVPPRVGLMS